MTSSSTPKAHSTRRRPGGQDVMKLPSKCPYIEEENEVGNTTPLSSRSNCTDDKISNLSSEKIRSTYRKNNLVKNAHGSQKRRRKPKKPTLSLFSSTPTVKVRPSAFLNTQQSYTQDILPLKIQDLKKDKRLCSIKYIQQLEVLEDNLLQRMGTVSNLKLIGKDKNDVLIEKKYSLISEIQDSVMDLQTLIYDKKKKLDKVRMKLRQKNQGSFVCCEVCYDDKQPEVDDEAC